LRSALPSHALNAVPQAPKMERKTDDRAQSSSVQDGKSRFLTPISECELQLTTILEELSRDTWPYPNDQRQRRSTGTALAAAISLLEATSKNQNARILSFVGG